MWSLSCPQIPVAEILYRCCDGMRPRGDLNDRVLGSVNFFEYASHRYRDAAQVGAVLQLDPAELAPPTISQKEMSWLYSKRFAAAGTPNRETYDELLVAPEHGICPYCNDRAVKALDHLMPKSYLPAFAVNPLNLVPICTDCNSAKRDDTNATSGRSTMHPYFESAEHTSWLRASLDPVNGEPVFVFWASPSSDLSTQTSEKIINHFTTLGLAAHYSQRAGQHYSGIVRRLVELYSMSGRQDLWSHLNEERLSWEGRDRNSWYAAFYSALMESDWVMTGDFRTAAI